MKHLFKRLLQWLEGLDNQSDLEKYVLARNPSSIYEIEILTKEYYTK